MKALIYEGPRSMCVREVAEPEPGEDDVLIQVMYSGICGSELSGYLGQNALRTPPCIFGHELSGMIALVGERAHREWGYSEGLRVTANPLVTCGRCPRCLEGRQQLCENRRLISAALPGSHSEYVRVPAACVHELPDSLSWEQGATVEPIACAVRAAELAVPHPADSVVILGMGPIGLLVLQVLRAHGVTDILAVDRNRDRLAMAEELGARTFAADSGDVTTFLRGRGGVDFAVDAVGAEATRRQCCFSVRPGGRVVLTGLHADEAGLPVNHLIRSEIQLLGSFAYSAQNFSQALHLLASGKVGIKPEWTVLADLAEGAQWHERLLGDAGPVAKVLLTPGGKV